MDGPIELTAFGSVLRAVGVLYWILALLGLAAALALPKQWWSKALAASCVLAGFGWMPVRFGLQAYEASKRLEVATALFEQRCKTAGEKVSRTVDNVDGVVWMKWRAETPNQNDQFALDDPFGRDCGGEGCIDNLLRVTRGADLDPRTAASYAKAYRFVESTDPSGHLYRYTGVIKLRPFWTPEALARQQAITGKGIQPYYYQFALEREPTERWQARYGITWDDVSTWEDREHWIAGGSLKVIDLQANEVIAERVGYMMDRGLGSTADFRSPWNYAPWNACPAFPKTAGGAPFMGYRTRDFVLKVLKPSQEGQT